MISKWFKNDPKLTQKWSKIVAKMIPNWFVDVMLWLSEALVCFRASMDNFLRSITRGIVNKNSGKRIFFLMLFWDFQKLSFVFAPPGITFCALSPGLILGLCWDLFGIIWGSFWDHFGIMLGSCWDHFEIILGAFWNHFGACLNVVCGCHQKSGAAKAHA